VFVVYPLPDTQLAQFQHMLSSDDLVSQRIEVKADRRHDVWENQTARFADLVFDIHDSAKTKRADAIGCHAYGLPYRSIQLVGDADVKKLATAKPDFDAPMDGTLRFTKHWTWHPGDNPPYGGL
jgi:hypothetical protein